MYELWNDKGSEILKSWIGLNVVFDNIFLQFYIWIPLQNNVIGGDD